MADENANQSRWDGVGKVGGDSRGVMPARLSLLRGARVDSGNGACWTW